MSSGAVFLTTARQLLETPEGTQHACVILQSVDSLPGSLCSDAERESARTLLARIESGEYHERLRRQAEKQKLLAEAHALMSAMGAGISGNRVHRRAFRAELAEKVRRAIAEGESVNKMQRAFGVSGYTIQRAINQIKREYFRNPDMTNPELRQRLRSANDYRATTF